MTAQTGLTFFCILNGGVQVTFSQWGPFKRQRRTWMACPHSVGCLIWLLPFPCSAKAGVFIFLTSSGRGVPTGLLG